MSRELLTLLSTSCIILSGASLLVGWYFIRWRRAVSAHRNAMIGATVLAGAFLVLYVTRWSLFGSKSFAGEGVWLWLYVLNLVPHIILAIAVGPLALRLLYLAGIVRDYTRHARLARITLPMWLYVSASGWVIYLMLYKLPV